MERAADGDVDELLHMAVAWPSFPPILVPPSYYPDGKLIQPEL